jgi:hypothetical protein
VFRHAPKLSRYLCWQCDALTNSLFSVCHGAIMRQSGASLLR